MIQNIMVMVGRTICLKQKFGLVCIWTLPLCACVAFGFGC